MERARREASVVGSTVTVVGALALALGAALGLGAALIAVFFADMVPPEMC
jgi:hypothetical protein